MEDKTHNLFLKSVFWMGLYNGRWLSFQHLVTPRLSKGKGKFEVNLGSVAKHCLKNSVYKYAKETRHLIDKIFINIYWPISKQITLENRLGWKQEVKWDRMTKTSDSRTTKGKSLLLETSNGWELCLAEIVWYSIISPKNCNSGIPKIPDSFPKMCWICFMKFFLRWLDLTR